MENLGQMEAWSEDPGTLVLALGQTLSLNATLDNRLAGHVCPPVK